MLSSVIIVATVSSDYSQATASSVLGDAFIGLILALIVAVAIAFIGVKISKSKQAAFNSNAEYMMRQADERRQAAQDNQKILNVYQENVTEMHLYEHLVPEQYRTSAKVGTIIDLLKEDKAETVEEACSLFG
jgi:L-lactate permease